MTTEKRKKKLCTYKSDSALSLYGYRFFPSDASHGFSDCSLPSPSANTKTATFFFCSLICPQIFFVPITFRTIMGGNFLSQVVACHAKVVRNY